MQSRPLRIGTRGSPLALWQASMVRDRLIAAHGLDGAEIELQIIRTSGDRIQDRPLREFGGKGLFTKEIEEALLAKEVDLAVHSMKDVPTVLFAGLVIDCLLPREDVRDAFLSTCANSIEDLAEGARVGTSSLRRKAQVLRLRPDLEVVDFRGNVETRLRKLEDGEVDATLLALAGLSRLGLRERATGIVPPEIMLPAVAQGAIGVESRAEDERVAQLLAPLHDADTEVRVACERAFLARLDGSCRTPIAALAELESGGRMRFRGMILMLDGSQSFETARDGRMSDASSIGVEAAEELLGAAGPEFLAALV